MKKTMLYSVLFILLSLSVSAACYDSDDGPENLATPARYLGIDGFVTQGNTTYYDSCISRKGGTEMDDSLWIREYYCDNNSDVAFEDYFCPGHYYVECLTVHKAAACDDYSGPADYNETSAVNTTNTTNTTAPVNSSNTTSNQSSTTIKPVNCGDYKVEFGEECDPPGNDCYTKALTKGVCDFNCICDPSLTPELFKSLNRSVNQEDSSNEITASATFEANDSDSEPVVKEAKNTSSGITGGITIDPVADLIKEAKKPSEDFSDSIGIKITSAITSAVMSIWNILMSAIGG
ncbi:hypothetical protein GF343_02920 [Candidatus Woesearchaeota archaeon]|nr:hypothetical protein [Candidatus Woesearchaeota archaeon]